MPLMMGYILKCMTTSTGKYKSNTFSIMWSSKKRVLDLAQHNSKANRFCHWNTWKLSFYIKYFDFETSHFFVSLKFKILPPIYDVPIASSNFLKQPITFASTRCTCYFCSLKLRSCSSCSAKGRDYSLKLVKFITSGYSKYTQIYPKLKII